MKLIVMLIALSAVLMTACTEKEDYSYTPSFQETTQKATYPVLSDPNGELEDAPETAPVIIEPDVPETEPQTEIYNPAPETMPEE